MDTLRTDLQDLLEGYARKSFKPSEVLDAHLKAIESRNGKLNALLEVRTDDARKRAAELDDKMGEASKLPLFGVPIAIKDSILVRGWKATAGSKILADYVAPFSATVVERLEAAGAIVVGKANCDEFTMGSSNENSAFGPVRNPWDLERVPGGSSGGSAAAVAGGFAPVALGTDTGGSIRQPASLCGVVGLKPSYGRVSRYGVIAYASSLDQVGPFGRTVWDAARLTEVMGGYDSRDATSSRSVVAKYTDNLAQVTSFPRGVTVGVCREWMEGCESEVRKAFDDALHLFKSEGAKIVDVQLPHSKYALSTYYLIAPSEASSNLARYDGVHYGFRASDIDSLESVFARSRGQAIGSEVKLRIMLGTYALSAGYYDAYYTKANLVRRKIQKDFEEAFSRCQVVLSPTSPTTAFKLGDKTADPLTMYLSDIFTLPANLAGIPGLSVPCGKDSKGLPIGLQLLGKSFDEDTLLKIGHGYERARGGFPLPSAQGGAK